MSGSTCAMSAVPSQRERLLDVVQIAMRDRRGAPQQRAARPTAVARALAAVRERGAKSSPKRVAARLLVAVARRLLERGERLLRGVPPSARSKNPRARSTCP